MQRMLGHYLTLLDAALDEPRAADQRVWRCSPPHELAAIDMAEHAADADYDRHACVHDLVADQAHRNPNATAVTFGDQSLTYAELDGRANQLAHHLIDLGVEPGAFVGLHLERSAEMVIALLATLKAGAAYLPLDPGFPADRLEFMQTDSRTTVVITTADLLPATPPADTTYVTVDASARTIAQHPSSRPDTSGDQRRSRLRHLHLGLHRSAQGRRRSNTATSSTSSSSMTKRAGPAQHRHPPRRSPRCRSTSRCSRSSCPSSTAPGSCSSTARRRSIPPS